MTLHLSIPQSVRVGGRYKRPLERRNYCRLKETGATLCVKGQSNILFYRVRVPEISHSASNFELNQEDIPGNKGKFEEALI